MDNYDATKPSSFLIYLDATNLYGWAMSQSLPTCKSRWLDNNEILNFNPLLIANDSTNGYVLEADIVYPEYLHDAHNDLPILYHLTANIQNYLIITLYGKNNYIIHYKNLKTIHGLKVKEFIEFWNFHRVPG